MINGIIFKEAGISMVSIIKLLFSTKRKGYLSGFNNSLFMELVFIIIMVDVVCLFSITPCLPSITP